MVVPASKQGGFKKTERQTQQTTTAGALKKTTVAPVKKTTVAPVRKTTVKVPPPIKEVTKEKTKTTTVLKADLDESVGPSQARYLHPSPPYTHSHTKFVRKKY